MTKGEYARLLQTEYWKGYSYALIKERNFTCGDCGRRFYNQRHKLQVHHLVYRDTYPWSYKPEEVIVLCDECHKRRHGFYAEPNENNDEYHYLYKTSWFSRYKEFVIITLFIILVALVMWLIKSNPQIFRHKTPAVETVIPTQTEEKPAKATTQPKTRKKHKTTGKKPVVIPKSEDILEIVKEIPAEAVTNSEDDAAEPTLEINPEL